MKVNFYLKEPQHDSKDGPKIKTGEKKETPIVVSITHATQRIKIQTDKTIHPKHWNFADKNLPVRKSYKNHIDLNNWLTNIRNQVGTIVIEWKEKHRNENKVPPIPIDYLGRELKQYLSKETTEEREERLQNSFWGYYDRFLGRMNTGVRVHSKNGTPLSKRTICQFNNLKRHLQNFEKSEGGFILDFENIDLKFYNAFTEYVTTKLKLAPNTIGKLITNLKVFMREAFEEGLTKNNTFTHRKFKTISAQSDTIYLTIPEIKQIQELKLSDQPRYERVRDLFVIGCYTGLRYSDLIRITPEKINDGMIELTQAKTGGFVFIPIVSDVLQILKKYNYKMPRISNQKYNAYLKKVVEKCELLNSDVTVTGIKGGAKFSLTVPKHNLVSSHTARRSFATNEYKAKDLTVNEIMSITGHKTEKAFYKYIRETPKETAERIKEKFKQRELRQAAGRGLMKAV